MERRSRKLINRVDRVLDRFDFGIVIILFILNSVHSFFFDQLPADSIWFKIRLFAMGIVSTLFVLVLFHTIFRILIGHRRVDVKDVIFFILGYIILILQFALFLGCLDHLAGIKNVLLFENLESGSIVDYIYYSGNVMTSLGFGDIFPVHPWSKTLCVLEAILGQVMLVLAIGTVIAQIPSQGRRAL